MENPPIRVVAVVQIPGSIPGCSVYHVFEDSDTPLGHEIYHESGILLAKLTPVGVCRVKTEIFLNVI